MYEAIYHPDPKNPYPKEVIYYPQVVFIGTIGIKKKMTIACLR